MTPAGLTRTSLLVGAPGILLVLILSFPCLRLGYFWDDYVFLTRVQSNPIAALGPEPAPALFYRPIPRAVYFWPLAGLGSDGAPVAHGINLILLAASVWLLASLVGRAAGPKAGAIAGIAFATLAPVPSLVAWASASQDLLAILFSLMAFHLRHSGRIALAGIAFAAGLLSKETTAVLAPALVLWSWIVGMRPARTRAAAITIGGILIAWLIVHPGIRGFASNGFEAQPLQHIGFLNLALSEFHARRYLLALFNIPQGIGGPWSLTWLVLGIVAAAIAAVALRLVDKTEHASDPRRLSTQRAFLLAFLISAPALALPALLVQHWAGYLACLPGLGSSLLIGVVLSRIPVPAVVAALGVFATLGLSIRGSQASGADSFTERTFVDASRAIRQVEAGFRKLRPTFPRGSHVLVSVAASGQLGIDATMHDGQPLRIWYRDPTLQILRPERRVARPPAEFLFRITEDRDVVEIDPDEGSLRTSGGGPDVQEMRAIIRTYARGLAASGESPRAIRIFGRLTAGDEEPLRSYDIRLAAMALLAKGDRGGAAQLIAQAAPISREFALESVARVMAEPTGRADFDSCAFIAFGVSSSDPEALRHLMNLFYASQFVPQAIDFARRLQEVAPADSESAAILARLGAK
ncbi:MAG TPA: hypothetical protein VK527_00550 [Candidatus Limnocylindrales bacterium]|nr:hypothetical protein [Candidatus Limnocylindrales bacterium]